MSGKKFEPQAGELNRLGAGGMPITERQGGPVPVLRARKDSLKDPQRRNTLMSFGETPTPSNTPGASPARHGALKHAETPVRGHVRGTSVVRPYRRSRPEREEAGEPEANPLAKTRERDRIDTELWHQWISHEPGSPERKDALKQLLVRYKSVIDHAVYQWNSAMNQSAISDSALRGHFRMALIDALNRYNPEKGAALRTFVPFQFRGVHRFVTTNQNIARIPQNIVNKIGKVRTARQVLMDDLGRTPTDKEVADHLQIPVKTVLRIDREVRAGGSISSLEAAPALAGNEVEQALRMFREQDVTPREWAYIQYMLKAKVEDDLKPATIKKRLGWTATEVSRAKTGVTKRLRRALGEIE